MDTLIQGFIGEIISAILEQEEKGQLCPQTIKKLKKAYSYLAVNSVER
jgi:hypothetical protein